MIIWPGVVITSIPRLCMGIRRLSALNSKPDLTAGDFFACLSELTCGDSEKPNSPYATTGTQANFETYTINSKGESLKIGNGHLNITD